MRRLTIIVLPVVLGVAGYLAFAAVASHRPDAENCVRLWEQPWLASMMDSEGKIDGRCVWTAPRP